MRPILTSEQARALEREAEARGTSVGTLMERAGYAVARVAADVAGGAYGRRAVVVCGKGNNAGDGFVAARYLDAWGMAVSVLVVAERYGEPAATNLTRLSRSGARVLPFTPAAAERELDRADVGIDAIFGLGFRGRPEDEFAAAITSLNDGAAPVVCVDIPSGVEANTGAAPGPSVTQTVTVTFGAPKVGNVLGAGAYPANATLVIADLGYPADLVSRGDRSAVSLVEQGDPWLPAPRPPDAHKREAVVLIVAGSRRMTGAPTLVARGAYRAGAGLVTIAVPEGILPVVQGGMSEATFLPLPEGPSGSVADAAWKPLEEVLAGFDVVAIGPGLSTDEDTPDFVRRFVRACPVPMVADADAVNAFAGRAKELADRRASLVITPHAGELARLLDRSVDELTRDPLAAARAATAAIRGPVLLKGWRTLVSEPGGRVKVNTTGTPVLATAGTGDVLTGVIAALAARAGEPGHAPMDDAAIAGAHVHGLAGRLAGQRYGEGAIATGVADAVAEVIRSAQEMR